jgi:hypothetical protein
MSLLSQKKKKKKKFLTLYLHYVYDKLCLLYSQNPNSTVVRKETLQITTPTKQMNRRKLIKKKK